MKNFRNIGGAPKKKKKKKKKKKMKIYLGILKKRQAQKVDFLDLTPFNPSYKYPIFGPLCGWKWTFWQIWGVPGYGPEKGVIGCELSWDHGVKVCVEKGGHMIQADDRAHQQTYGSAPPPGLNTIPISIILAKNDTHFVKI